LIQTIDPRRGDIEDDASSPKGRSLLALAGTLLAEVSITKLVLAWMSLVIVPALMLGIAPIVASIWIAEVFDSVTSYLVGVWSIIVLVALAAVGWFGGRGVFRLAEKSFWSLNSLIVQPAYTICREALRHVVGKRLLGEKANLQHPLVYKTTALLSGLVICGLALCALVLAWPSAQLIAEPAILRSPTRLAGVALANSIALICAYVAAAALGWGVADATMDEPRDRETFDPLPPGGRSWRIAHLSDVHTVGERYGFRIESGRLGPRGNDRLKRLLDQLDALHAKAPLHAIMMTGDMTDAGRSAEWAEFFDAIASHPRLNDLLLMIPGNHDLNIVDRANPARLDLPLSPSKRLRELRALSAIAAVQGARVRIVDQARGQLGDTLEATLAPHRAAIAKFADSGKPALARDLSELWTGIFPMVLPPDRDDGLGIILLNSNADTHFSFTNALGMIPLNQAQRMDIAVAQYPDACWVIALHHHVVEYPRAAKALSVRIGTALVNGNWFVRHLGSLAGRAILLHGHRHIDWIGQCAGLTIISAPSPVMNATDDATTCFYIHTFARAADGRLSMLAPERVAIAGEPASKPEAIGSSAAIETARV